MRGQLTARQRPYSDKPFPETVNRLLEEEELGLREMIRRARKVSKNPRSISTAASMIRGDAGPSAAVMEMLAELFRVDPEFFAEYRMRKARQLFEPEKREGGVGFTAALRNLQALERLGVEADRPIPRRLVAGRRDGKGSGPGKAGPP
jgi:transcriptional regulator with XRE-family HTH domain